MNVSIEERSENEGLKRERVTAAVSFDGTTPSRADVRDALATEFPDGHVVVRSITGAHGGGSASVAAVVYRDSDVMEAVEQEYVLDRHGAGDESESAEEAE